MNSPLRTTVLPLLAVLAPLLAGTAAADPPSPNAVTIRIRPDPVYIERTGDRQFLSFELELLDATNAPLDLEDIRVRAFDKDDHLLAWEKLDGNGSRPSIEVLGPHHLEPGKPLTVFNPFSELDTAVPITLLRFELRFSGPNGRREKALAEVRPQAFVQKTSLILPVAGVHLWAYEASGFYSHHRRLDLNDPFNHDIMKLTRNSQRYALDLVVVDDQGEAFHGDPGKQENWVGLGVPIVAPGSGTIVAAVGNKPDDIPFDLEAAKKEPALMAGNYLVIDHGNGEYSMLGHFRTGTLAVKPGDHVERGQLLAKMGHSGMGSGLVHVHYELRNSPDLFDGDGLPATFQGFRRVGSTVPEPGRVGPGWVVVTEGK